MGFGLRAAERPKNRIDSNTMSIVLLENCAAMPEYYIGLMMYIESKRGGGYTTCCSYGC